MSDGSPSEKNAYADIQAAYDWLTSEGGVPANRIIFFGRSLGSGPTTHLASKSEVGAGLVTLLFFRFCNRELDWQRKELRISPRSPILCDL